MQPHPHAQTGRDALRVALSGDVDIARQRELTDLVTAFRHSDAATVEVDLADVEFMDSTGLTAIMRLRSIALERGGIVRLLQPSRPVRRALEVSGMTAVCELVD
jgi:anti-sigma B factor antagonist